ncbi:tetratricopeptide repeat protein, partial [Neisseria sp. P0016.S008]
MNKLLKKMMVALLAFGIGQAAWAEDVSDLDKLIQNAKQGSVPAQSSLGAIYLFREDYASATYWLRKAAEQGQQTAQKNLGLLYYNGVGVNQDYEEALKWFRKSAEQGYAQAQYNLGW